MKTISNHIREFLEGNNVLSNLGGQFSGKDFIAIEKVLSNNCDNFIVFNNGGGKMFHIWFFDDMKKTDSKCTLEGFIDFAKSQKGYIYMQKIKGKEQIFQNLPSAKPNNVWQEIVDVLAK